MSRRVHATEAGFSIHNTPSRPPPTFPTPPPVSLTQMLFPNELRTNVKAEEGGGCWTVCLAEGENVRRNEGRLERSSLISEPVSLNGPRSPANRRETRRANRELCLNPTICTSHLRLAFTLRDACVHMQDESIESGRCIFHFHLTSVVAVRVSAHRCFFLFQPSAVFYLFILFF